MEPKRLVRAFAEEGLKNTIPDMGTESTAANAATYQKGFPAVTMTPIAVGGQPPSGKDMNGILYELSSHIAYMNKGGQYKFDADFCEEVGGYDIGAIVLSDNGMIEYINTLANNKTNPNTTGSKGWKICSGADPVGKLLSDRDSIFSASSVRTGKIVDAIKDIAKGSAGDVVNKSPLVIYVASREEFVTKQGTQEMQSLPDGAVAIVHGYFYERKTGSTYIPDLPNWIPINESFGHFDAKYAETGKSSVTTKYVNTDGLIYNVTYVENIKPSTIRKYYSGLDKSAHTADLVTLRKAATEKKYPCVLMNCDVFTESQGALRGKTKLQGLQVVDNEILQDFNSNDSRDTLVMLRSGWLDVVKKSDNLSLEQIKNKGIVWSAYFGPTLIKDGNIQAGLPQNELSARNIIGQKSNRDIVIIQVQGETGKSGCTLQKAAELLLAEGCIFGFNLDGGGSTQMWWQDCYSFLSSDSDFSKERAVGGIIEIRTDDTGIFDTGWQPIQTAEGISSADADLNIPAVCYRQVGAEIQLRISVSGNFTAGYSGVITTQTIPRRFTSVNFRDMRGMLVGSDLSYGMWYAGNYLSLRAIEKSAYFTGLFKWNPRNAFTY
nr:MAG TPA: tail fiber protein [Caudoviricetes sp.]